MRSGHRGAKTTVVAGCAVGGGGTKSFVATIHSWGTRFTLLFRAKSSDVAERSSGTRKLSAIESASRTIVSLGTVHWIRCVHFAIETRWTNLAGIIASLILETSSRTGNWIVRSHWTVRTCRTHQRIVVTWIRCTTWTVVASQALASRPDSAIQRTVVALHTRWTIRLGSQTR